MKPVKIFIVILILAVLLFYVNLPNQVSWSKNIFGRSIEGQINIPHPTIYLLGTPIPTSYPLHLGLDLAGGSHLVFEAQSQDLAIEERNRLTEALTENIRRRIDIYGVSESLVQSAWEDEILRIIVELPGVEDTKEAIALVGQTAQLDFRRQADEASVSAGFVVTDLTGADLKSSGVDFNPNTNQPVVTLEFTDQGREKFAQITQEVQGQILAIFLDEVPLSFPVVEEPITQGQALISGQFSLDEAKKLSAQLNAGALPVSLDLVSQKTVEATLGDQSIRKSIIAGLVGLAAVAIFTLAFYGSLGLFACFSLFIYALASFFLYRIIPITLTLPGIAGFVLSVGMAVDANIVIFERLRAELRTGKSYQVAREVAFGKAWDSIKDANICTLIAGFVLFNPFDWSFLPLAGMVRGFALTLSLGVIVSLFTGIVVTRNLMRVFSK
ncbi:MAG: protein translocase subunit SecD [Candidatus Shapirobacteria bacterium]|nr:protein translocase subunit SecD [Candidatus Shapirobacteria bacterium]MDD5481609.1 protein translocase subunit SecD [Candidatus Shapirobacteria bacterium]